jgi:hypothetical protein
MPNVLDIAPLRALARRAASKIRDQKVAARFEKLAIGMLLKDESSFREANAADFAMAEEWALRAAERGERVVVFRLKRALSSRLHLVARRLAETCRLAAMDHSVQTRDATAIIAARGFLAKIDRMTYDLVAIKSQRFAHTLAAWEDQREIDECCERRVIDATPGRTWHRVTSVAELRLIGREFHNCLARTTRASTAYGGGLYHGVSQFWVLRGADGAGLIVAMATAPRATRFVEVRGPNNATIYSDQPDLTCLAIALGMRPAKPPPPPPQAISGAALALAARQFCQCLRCAPPPSNDAFLRVSLHQRPTPL